LDNFVFILFIIFGFSLLYVFILHATHEFLRAHQVLHIISCHIYCPLTFTNILILALLSRYTHYSLPLKL